ncbi:TPA: NAD(P)-binding domain-containing protein, partial [Staphylococcus pseudintermedius]|nr:NAD(P)-binding domain-containing protein [Staphylococcus pseudintermedius]HAR5894625.1 NAD(P)-binding domain-containing protein [Staphylococcus pseudintermedius]HAR5933678.1 NAD(P)-binding domain-containing protein [Staphylococcus pseudintermedius]HAR5998671.1 NAD(P)-binding domain-containing protein [Staphylococcus pseudintermedius]
MTNITVFGTGSFGTALANVLADNGHNTLMWGKTSTTIDEINHEHTNHNYLKGVTLNSTIQATTDIQTAIDHSDIYLIALPTKAIREVMSQVNQLLISKKSFIHVTKGIENATFKRVSEMLEDSISPEYNAGIGVLSGPSHAEEVVIKQPTTVSAASSNPELRKLIQDLFMT